MNSAWRGQFHPALASRLTAGIVMLFAPEGSARGQTAPPAPLRIIVDGEAFAATLAPGAPAADFYAQLPLTLDMQDYAGKEKTATPPRPVNPAGGVEGHAPRPGDMMLFSPWASLAFFYGAAGPWPGMYLLGRMEAAAVEAIARPGMRKVRIERGE